MENIARQADSKTARSDSEVALTRLCLCGRGRRGLSSPRLRVDTGVDQGGASDLQLDGGR